MTESFDEWKSKQDLRKVHGCNWWRKYTAKKSNAKNLMFVEFNLSFEEYLFKAFSCGLSEPNQVSRSGGYHLSRKNDLGGYVVDNCEFISGFQNQSDRHKHTPTNVKGVLNGRSKLTVEQVTKIWYDDRTDYDEIAKEFKCLKETVSMIKRGKRWTCVTNCLTKIN